MPCSLVSHAVGAAMRDLLGDWYLMVTQLEHQLLLGRLTLQVGMNQPPPLGLLGDPQKVSTRLQGNQQIIWTLLEVPGSSCCLSVSLQSIYDQFVRARRLLRGAPSCHSSVNFQQCNPSQWDAVCTGFNVQSHDEGVCLANHEHGHTA